MQNVVVKFVLLIPQPDAFAAKFVHCRGDAEEVLEKLGRDIFVNVVLSRELNRDPHQVQREHSHPAGAVALLEMRAVGEHLVAIEHADIVQPQKAALKNIFSLRVLAVHPPGERDQHFVEDRFQKRAVAFAGLLALDLVNAPCRPRQYRRIHVVKIPFVGGNFPVRMLIPFAHDQLQLRLGELHIDQREGQTVKGEVPRRVPRKFPFIRHRHDAFVIKMTPASVAAAQSFLRRRRQAGIAIEPLVDDIVIILLVPKQSGERLTLNCALLLC